MSDTQHTTFTPIDYTPVYAGHWSIGGTEGMRILLAKRPNWFHQKMAYIFIGWKWTDTKENTEEFENWRKESDDGADT
jgi:hypothetical protein